MNSPNNEVPTQWECTEAIVEANPDNGVMISNLGVSSWILSAVEDRKRNYYMKGAMGTTTSVGLGLAIGRDEPITVLDGDGSLLMSLGSLTTVSRQNPENLIIVLMNNSEFTTTGGQPTLAKEADIADVGTGCGLEASCVSSLDSLVEAYEEAIEYPGTALIDCHTISEVPDEYPEPDYAHSYLKHRFRTALTEQE